MKNDGSTGIAPGSYPRPDVPRLSLTERDRRWSRVRELMAREQLDAILCFGNSEGWDYGNANGRYLTTLGGNSAWISVVFPLEGEVTAVTGPVPAPSYWLAYQDWVQDVRTTFFHATPEMIVRLRELGLERGRIGISGLAGLARQPDGHVSHGVMLRLEQELPHAELVNATQLLYEARYVKSDEEVALLARAADVVEDAMETLEREARPGVPEQLVYARMIGTMLERGAEPNSLLLWTAGNPLPPATATLASRRPLAPDDVIQVEADAKWAGYLGHSTRTVWVGKPDATDRAMIEVQQEAVRRCCQALRPGTPLGRFVEICAEVAADTPFECAPIMHSRGLGADLPVLVFHARDERTRDWPVERNAVFVIKPRVTTPDGLRNVIWGDTVVATPDGGRRLSSRPAPLSAPPAR